MDTVLRSKTICRSYTL